MQTRATADLKRIVQQKDSSSPLLSQHFAVFLSSSSFPSSSFFFNTSTDVEECWPLLKAALAPEFSQEIPEMTAEPQMPNNMNDLFSLGV